MSKKSFVRIALAGNPNSGKSTLFNALTGLNQKTGNFPGVTVDKKTGQKKIYGQDGSITEALIIDLPGTYSLYPKSLDEKVTFDVLTDMHGKHYPDITIIVADAANLKRNLLLASQIIDLKRPVVVALNMCDVAENLGYVINAAEIEKQLGVPVIAVNSRERKGVDELEKIILSARSSELLEKNSHGNMSSEIMEDIERRFPSSSRFGSMLRMSESFNNEERSFPQDLRDKLGGKDFFRRFETQDNLERFKIIGEVWNRCVQSNDVHVEKTVTEKLDAILTHRIFGVVIFIGILFLIFQSIFFLAEYPMTWIEQGFLLLQEWTSATIPPGMINELVTNGIIAGLSGIVVFVPQIALLFGFLAILEDTGYMARVSFIMDKMMRGFGLNGRSVIPLMSGVACAVPAIMGARTISNVKERIITILVTPLMSCSARLPVYTLLISLMVPEGGGGFFNERGLWLMALYVLGFVSAILVALALKFILKAKERSYFIMELPVYRLPQLRSAALAMYSKVKIFLWDAGRVIMAISIVLWFLSSYGPGDKMEKIRQNYSVAAANQEEIPEEVAVRKKSELLEASYAGHVGKFIEPAIKPLGFDWKIGISLITSFAAREVFVGTMATIYSSSDDLETVREKLALQKDPVTGKKVYSRAVCLSLLIFYVFAMQCMSTFAIVRRETATWKWPLVQFFYMTAMAWLGSFAVYQILS